MTEKVNEEGDLTKSNDLTQFRTLYLMGDIEGKTMDKLFSGMMALQLADPQAPVRLAISSGGGSTRASLTFCDLIRHFFTVPIHGIAIGHCHSAATFILASCQVRMCTPNTTFVIHSNTTKASFRVDDTLEERMRDFLRDTQMTAEMVVAHYVRTLGVTAEKAKELIKRGDKEFDNELSAAEAKEIGLVTEIVEGKLDIFPPLHPPT